MPKGNEGDEHRESIPSTIPQRLNCVVESLILELFDANGQYFFLKTKMD